jgi:deoxycytidylate deaminase
MTPQALSHSLLHYPTSELMVGLVAPIGVDLDRIVGELKDRLEQHFAYRVIEIRLSALLRSLAGFSERLRETPEAARIASYMNAGNEVRSSLQRGDALALLALNRIAQVRSEPTTPESRTAYLLRSLKHPAEVHTLRQVYGDGFFLLAVDAPRSLRLDYLTHRMNVPGEEADQLIARDEAEGEEFGQQTRDAFELADAFISLQRPHFTEDLWRILDLLFGNPFLTPTADEHAMFHAYAAGLRSGDLSRQVGAVVALRSGEIVATGANDVPRAGGGLYWPGADDERDYTWGYDSNAQRREEMVLEILTALESVSTDVNRDVLRRKLQDTTLWSITEYGRAVHAEMEALLSCARTGVSTRGASLFSTTFPCHNCAKHIVAAGIVRVVYVEPYPKSLALHLHKDAIALAGNELQNETGAPQKRDKVRFEPFVGVGPRRFLDLFSLRLGSGYPLRRKTDIQNVAWGREDALLRLPLPPTSYFDREKLAIAGLGQLLGGEHEHSEEDN